ncbi:hypothetical protein HWV62_15365 [Athelia sp. TMB]|nr:hypothetical protein HWV62_15365 [Athelia sp. TMB]
MSLSSGRYIITNPALGTPVGRGLIEDRSLHPKRILALGKNVDPNDDALWDVIATEDDKYILRTRGSPTGRIDDKVWGILTGEDERVTKWTLQSTAENNTYT